MKKFVLKIIGITLLAIFALACLTYSVFLIFAPGVLSDFHNGIGNYGKAAIYAYKQYDASKNIADLDKASKYAIKTGNDLTIVKYLSVLTENDDFYDYCINDEALGKGYYEFMCGKYVCSLYNTSTGEDRKSAADKANALSVEYGKDCPMRALMFKVIEASDTATIEYIKQLDEARIAEATEDEKKIIESDIAIIDEIMENK